MKRRNCSGSWTGFRLDCTLSGQSYTIDREMISVNCAGLIVNSGPPASLPLVHVGVEHVARLCIGRRAELRYREAWRIVRYV